MASCSRPLFAYALTVSLFVAHSRGDTLEITSTPPGATVEIDGVVVGTTLAGTTLADFADRSLGIGYPGGTAILLGLVIASLVVWKMMVGTVSVNHIVTPKAEMATPPPPPPALAVSAASIAMPELD